MNVPAETGSGLPLPSATCRIQLRSGFPFAALDEILDYLHDLGIRGLYLSPFLTARPGSPHGYDVVNPSSVNLELGGEDALRGLCARARSRGFAVIADVVPNHMCIHGSGNPWWQDVLENGPSSPFSRVFDIDWHPPKTELANKVLLPFLGDQYGTVLENHQIRIIYRAGAFWAEYYELLLPLAPRSWTEILEPARRALTERLGESEERVQELESILTALNHLPTQTETDAPSVKERQREKEIIKRRLGALVEGSREVREAVDASVTDVNGCPGDPRSLDRLEALLDKQAYRLCYWRVAADEINYRRFFDVNELAAIRVEDPLVFDLVHGCILALVRDGCLTGLRVDHVDGLLDPRAYLRKLQRACGEVIGPRAAANDPERPIHLIVEKILSRGEAIRRDWPIHGTTGYEFLNLVNGLFVDPSAYTKFRALYSKFIGRSYDFDDLLITCKKFILLVSLASELHVLSDYLDQVSEQHRTSRDFTFESLRFALREVTAAFPTYRTYVGREDSVVREEDRRLLLSAVSLAKRRNPATPDSLFDFIGDVLTLKDPGGLREEHWLARRDFVLRFQQITGPVMAKGLEDTAFYRVYPLASLNEVGAEPEHFGVTPDEFHRSMAARLDHWPDGLSATTTHDTKRSEDVRARIDALSELPEAWDTALATFRALARPSKTLLGGREVPDANEEYLLYQTLVGAWPPEHLSDAVPGEEFTRRIRDYMLKALREAKVHTSWIQPDAAYDQAVSAFVEATLAPREDNRLRQELARFTGPIARAGFFTSLSQAILKIAAPGIPDLYQGTETWDFSLVDPDNRRPVDFARRRGMLAELDRRSTADLPALLSELRNSLPDGRIKLWVVSRALRHRAAHPDLFSRGAYLPLSARGERAAQVVAFSRKNESGVAIAVAARFFLRPGIADCDPVGALWKDTVLVSAPSLPSGPYRDILSGTVVSPRMDHGTPGFPLDQVFAHLPVALLERIEP